MAVSRSSKGVRAHVPGKQKKPAPHWTEVHLGIKPEVALAVVSVVAWGITLVLDKFTDVMDKVAFL